MIKGIMFAIWIALIATIAMARSEGLYNPSSNAVGDYQGIDSNAATATATTGSALLVDNTNPALLIDNVNPACLAGGC